MIMALLNTCAVLILLVVILVFERKIDGLRRENWSLRRGQPQEPHPFKKTEATHAQ